jgi:hypothetical protein
VNLTDFLHVINWIQLAQFMFFGVLMKMAFSQTLKAVFMEHKRFHEGREIYLWSERPRASAEGLPFVTSLQCM